jgi:hypothetical protein
MNQKDEQIAMESMLGQRKLTTGNEWDYSDDVDIDDDDNDNDDGIEWDDDNDDGIEWDVS